MFIVLATNVATSSINVRLETCSKTQIEMKGSMLQQYQDRLETLPRLEKGLEKGFNIAQNHPIQGGKEVN